MLTKVDYKKRDKELYQQTTTPCIVDVPKLTYLMVEGKGNPNTSQEYKDALEMLYGLSYTIKMSKKSNVQIPGYFDYVVCPLEGLWWTLGKFDGLHIVNKDLFCWKAMIRQPEFVTEETVCMAKKLLAKKKPELELTKAKLAFYEEGLCAQVLHIGSYDSEPDTIKRLGGFIVENGYETDITKERLHHEIYLSDPRRVAADKLKTIIRHPIKKK